MFNVRKGDSINDLPTLNHHSIRGYIFVVVTEFFCFSEIDFCKSLVRRMTLNAPVSIWLGLEAMTIKINL